MHSVLVSFGVLGLFWCFGSDHKSPSKHHCLVRQFWVEFFFFVTNMDDGNTIYHDQSSAFPSHVAKQIVEVV